jgi:hypothetical protein
MPMEAETMHFVYKLRLVVVVVVVVVGVLQMYIMQNLVTEINIFINTT